MVNPSSVPALARARALIVHDNAAQVRLVSKIVGELGLSAVGVGTGTEALASVAEFLPALVIVGAKLADMSGFEVCRLIKDDPRTYGVPVLMISGDSSAGNRRREALRAGAFDLIEKPFDAAAFHVIADHLLRRGGDTWLSQLAGQDVFNGTILVAEDDLEWHKLIRHWLEPRGYRVVGEDNERKIAETAARVKPDCIVLDFQLGTKTAADVCRELQADPVTKAIPIIVLTSLSNERLRSLKIGADYFAAKDGGPEELIANVEACLRRKRLNAGVVTVGDVSLDPTTLSVSHRGLLAAELSEPQFLILYMLVAAGEKGVSREELYQKALPDIRGVADSKALEKHLERIKEKVGPAIAGRIFNIKGFGWSYRPAIKPA